MAGNLPSHVIAVVAGMVGVLVGAVVVLATVMASAPRHVPEATSLPRASASPPPSPSPPPPNPDEKQPTTKVNVLVTAAPVDATIAIEDGSSDAPQLQPRTLALARDQKLFVRIERTGYRSLRLEIDPATTPSRLEVTLERDSTRRAVAEPRKEAPVAAAPARATSERFTSRPASCPPDDWDMFTRTCRPR